MWQLKQQLIECLGFTVKNVQKMALLVSELEKRGEKLDDLKIGIVPYLRKIARGVLLPEIIVKFAGDNTALKEVANMPIESQRKIVDGKSEYKPRPRYRNSVGKASTSSQVIVNDRDEKENAITGVAKRGTPRDIAEMMFGLVQRSPDSGMVLQHFFKMLVNHGYAVNVSQAG